MSVAIYETLRYFEVSDIQKHTPFLSGSLDLQPLSSIPLSPLPLFFWDRIFYLTTTGERKEDLHLYSFLQVRRRRDPIKRKESPSQAPQGEEKEAENSSALLSAFFYPPKAPLPFVSYSLSFPSPRVPLEWPSPTERPLSREAFPATTSLSVLVRQKTVQWEYEDHWSDLTRVARRIDELQHVQWKWWKGRMKRNRDERYHPLEVAYQQDEERGSMPAGVLVERDEDPLLRSHLLDKEDEEPNVKIEESEEERKCSGVEPALESLTDALMSTRRAPPPLQELREAMLVHAHLLPYYALNSEDRQALLSSSRDSGKGLPLSLLSMDTNENVSFLLSPFAATEMVAPIHNGDVFGKPTLGKEELTRQGQEEAIAFSYSAFPLCRSAHHAWLLEPCLGSVDALLFHSAPILPSISAQRMLLLSHVSTEEWRKTALPRGVEHPTAAIWDSFLPSTEYRPFHFFPDVSHLLYRISFSVISSFGLVDACKGGADGNYEWCLQDMVLDILTALDVLHHRGRVAHGDVSLGNILWTLPPSNAEEEFSHDTNIWATQVRKESKPRRRIQFVLGDLETLSPLSQGEREGMMNTPRRSSTWERSEVGQGISVEEREREGIREVAGPCCSTFRGTVLYASLEQMGGEMYSGDDESTAPSSVSAAGDVWGVGMVVLHLLLLQKYQEDRRRESQEDNQSNSKRDFQERLRLHPFAWDQRRLGLPTSLRLFRVATSAAESISYASQWSDRIHETPASTVFDAFCFLCEFKQECIEHQEKMDKQTSDGVKQDVFVGVKQVLVNMYGEDEDLMNDGSSRRFRQDSNKRGDPPRWQILNFLAHCLHPDPARRATVQELQELVKDKDF